MSVGESLLSVIGSTLASSGIAAGVRPVLAAAEWSEVLSPTSKTLYEVVGTDAGPFDVGESGTVIHRASSGWEMTISDGPRGQNKTLLGAGVTDGGDRLWMAGKSGTLGEYDVSTGELTDWSTPSGISNVFYDVEVTGTVDETERIYLTMSSGNVLVGERTGESTIEWSKHDTGGSNTLTAVDFHTATDGHVVSDSHNAFQTSDGGKTWTDVSPQDAQNPFYTVVSGRDHVYVGADNGQIWRRDCDCDNWTPTDLGSNKLYTIAGRGDDKLVAGGVASSTR